MAREGDEDEGGEHTELRGGGGGGVVLGFEKRGESVSDWKPSVHEMRCGGPTRRNPWGTSPACACRRAGRCLQPFRDGFRQLQCREEFSRAARARERTFVSKRPRPRDTVCILNSRRQTGHPALCRLLERP